MNIVMMGAQGTGKGTVAGILKNELNIPHISTGDIFRKNIKEGSELGQIATQYINDGKLVPDEVTNAMVKARLNESDCNNGFILDGYPRNIEQAKELDRILEENDKKVEHVINLSLELEEIMSRITNRRICSNSDCKEIYNLVSKPTKVPGICDKCGSPITQRDDDSDEEAIKKRLDIYFSQTEPLIDFYNDKGIVHIVKSDKAPKDIAKRIINIIR